MRTQLVLHAPQPAADVATPGLAPHRANTGRVGRHLACGVCPILIFALLMGCTRSNQDRDSSAPGATGTAPIAVADKSHTGPKAQNACELLTANEIAGILKTPKVMKDEHASTKNQMT